MKSSSKILVYTALVGMGPVIFPVSMIQRVKVGVVMVKALCKNPTIS